MEAERGRAEVAPPRPAEAQTPSNGGGRGRGGGGGGFRRSWRPRWSDGRPPRPRVRKLRFLMILLGLVTLALISTVFGMLLAVASDLPQLENTREFAVGQTSYLYDDQGRPIGPFLPSNHEVIDKWTQISPSMIHAIISVEDKRFWSDPGVDLRGVARAIWADITGGATQGASTIAEQFVKNIRQAENNRTIFEKIQEAALAFQLAHRWRKKKILTEYLNSIYFGNGAYGVESAARVYFGKTWATTPTHPRMARPRAAATAPRIIRFPRAPRSSSPGRLRCWPGWWPTPAASTPSPIRRMPTGGATWCSRTWFSSTT